MPSIEVIVAVIIVLAFFGPAIFKAMTQGYRNTSSTPAPPTPPNKVVADLPNGNKATIDTEHMTMTIENEKQEKRVMPIENVHYPNTPPKN